MKKVNDLHYVNHNIYGKRDPKQYGTITLDEINELIEKTAKETGIQVDTFQSNHEGENGRQDSPGILRKNMTVSSSIRAHGLRITMPSMMRWKY